MSSIGKVGLLYGAYFSSENVHRVLLDQWIIIT